MINGRMLTPMAICPYRNPSPGAQGELRSVFCEARKQVLEAADPLSCSLVDEAVSAEVAVAAKTTT
jgi:hypothetical protein